MEIEVKVRLKLKVDNSGWGFRDELRIYITYRLPDRLLRVRERIILSDSSWSKYETYDEFQNDTLDFLSNRRRIENVIKKEIKANLSEKSKRIKEEGKHGKIIKALEDNKFTVNIKL